MFCDKQRHIDDEKEEKWCSNGMWNITYLFVFLYEGIDRQTNRNNAQFELFVHRKQVFFCTFCVM